MGNGKKIGSNLVIGVVSQVITIVLGIILPRLTLTNYGSETNGLLSSVTQIYSYIALLEAGVGTATLQALYRTVGAKDQAGTNAILSATNRLYRKTGGMYLAAICMFAVVYPLLIETELPLETVVWVIILNGLSGVLSYFFHAKYLLLLQAEGKNYIQTTLSLVVNILKNIAKIVLISLGYSVVFVQVVAVIVSALQLAYVSWYIWKYYKWIDLSVEPNHQAISQSKNVLIHQLSGLVFNNTDTLILTIFCGLRTVSVYSMYILLFSMIGTFLNTLSTSVVFVLGQKFHSARKEFEKLHSCFELYYVPVVFALYAVANIFVLPFLELYTEGVNDISYVDEKLPLLFIATYLLSCGRKSSNIVINFAEHFKLTQNRSLIESCINLAVSLLAVQRFGIYGVLIGTIAALLYRTNDMILYANRKIMGRSPWITYRRWLLNLALFVLVTVGAKWFFTSVALDTYPRIIFWAAVSCVVIIPLFFAVVSLFDRETYRFARELLSPYLCRLIGAAKRTPRT